VLKNVTVKTELPEDGAEVRRNALEYQLNSVTSCMKGGALNVGLMRTDKFVLTSSVFLYVTSFCFVLSKQYKH
jgi:hypothetical protein